MKVWRDVDSNRRYFGALLTVYGGTVHIGRRCWRWRYR